MEAVGGTVREKQRDNESAKSPASEKLPPEAAKCQRHHFFLMHMLTSDNSVNVRASVASLKFLRAKTGSLARVLQVKRVKS